jgi:hypothetical protein
MSTNTSTNYFNKKSDLSLYPTKRGELPQTMGFGRSSAKAIAGPLKAAQNYARAILARRGDHPEDSAFGTYLMSDFSSTNLMLPMQITQIFSANNLRALTWLRSSYAVNTPNDEKINSASLKKYAVISKTHISFEVELITNSKEKLLFLLPVNL